jgi:hypothetical protein
LRRALDRDSRDRPGPLRAAERERIIHDVVAGTVLASIAAAGRAQKSVHWTARYSADIYGTVTYTANVNAHSGTQQVVGPGCYAGAGEWFRLVFVHHVVYAKGDVCGLMDYDHLDLTEAQAQQYAGQWILVPRRGAERGRYLSLVRGLTLASIVHSATTPKYAKLTVFRRFHGARLVLRGTPGWVQDGRFWELRARANGRRLPVAMHWGGGCCAPPTGEMHFSKWNEPVHVHAPAHSVAIATVRGG